MITGRAQLFYYPINEIINLSYLSVLQVCVLYFPQIANTFHIMNIKTDFFSRIILIVEMNLEKENVICAA